MPNVDRPRGFRPVRHNSGGEIRAEELTIANAQTQAFGQGTLVALTGTGREIQLSAPGAAAVGVFNGCKYTTPSGEIVYSQSWPGSAAAPTLAGSTVTAIVFTDPDLIYAGQHDGTPVAGNFGNLFDVTAEAVDALGYSTQEIDTSTNTTGAQLRTLGLVNAPDNELGEFAEQEFIIAAHQYRAAAPI